jgi:uncharacterized membrane protein
MASIHRMLKLRFSPAVVATTLVVALAPLAAPFLAATHPLTAWFIRSFFSRVCHQDPGRTFLIEGAPVAVCVRCLGIYWGTALGTLFRVRRIPAARLLASALLLNLLDVVTGALDWHGNVPLPRLLLGVLLGVGAGAVLFSRQGILPDRRED